MRDLFSQCTCVRTYVLVTLRNINLRSHQECHFALTPGQDTRYYTTTSGQRFLDTEDGEGSAAGPSRRMYLQSQVHKRVLNAADGWRLRDKKAERSQHTVEANRAMEIKKEFKSSKHKILHKPVIQAHSSRCRFFVLFFGLPLNETSDTSAACPISAARRLQSGARNHTHAQSQL